MPRVNVYLPDDLAALARPLGLNLSHVLQSALRVRIDSVRMEAWLGDLDLPGPPPGGHEATLEALQLVEGEPGCG